MTSTSVQQFIARWQDSGAAERANYQLFLTELCDILDVPRPEPTKPDDRDNAYVFERAVTIFHGDGTTRKGFIDLYKRGCFVLEAKQGAEKQTQTAILADAARSQRRHRKRGTATRHTAGMHEAMQRARNQAEAYTRALPAAEGRPPFLIVVDVGDTIELYAEFTHSGGTYVPFPDPRSHRLSLHDLLQETHRDTLRLVWTNPLALDPARRSARVTREIAAHLARLAQSLEASGHAPRRWPTS